MTEFKQGDLLELKCPCGETTIKTTAPHMAVGTCHCNECRRLTQGSAMEGLVYPSVDVFETVEGPLVSWKRPDMAMTVYACDKCKCMLYHSEKRSMVIVSTSEIVRQYGSADQVRATMHLNYKERTYDIDDKLPKFADTPDAFGGSGDMLTNDGAPAPKPES